MAQPRFQHPIPAEKQAGNASASHYFDAVNGDVAALHERIELGFADYGFGESPFSGTGNGLDSTIHLLSRSAGILGLAGALILLGIAIF